jgi:hypothetical protein
MPHGRILILRSCPLNHHPCRRPLAALVTYEDHVAWVAILNRCGLSSPSPLMQCRRQPKLTSCWRRFRPVIARRALHRWPPDICGGDRWAGSRSRRRCGPTSSLPVERGDVKAGGRHAAALGAHDSGLLHSLTTSTATDSSRPSSDPSNGCMAGSTLHTLPRTCAGWRRSRPRRRSNMASGSTRGVWCDNSHEMLAVSLRPGTPAATMPVTTSKC